ncbi:MAG TPA: twin-arginine translocase TatA/TatE family subunit [Terriglobales bacterium]|nr:twin-arginine translocase TatA/TatE family subunit [Terriglobales bacterium]
MPDIIFILLLALVIFGPKRLPEVARQLAKFVAQFRMMRDDLRRQLQSELLKIEMEEKQKAAVPPPAPVQETVSPPPQPKSLPEGSLS